MRLHDDPLRTARIDAGLTQQELADFAGITPTTISFIENGKVSPHDATKTRIEDVLGTRVNWERTEAEAQLT